ncbi:hypothetical protein SGPA1_30817 [Streptomyces misionensis JCM 4497]
MSGSTRAGRSSSSSSYSRSAFGDSRLSLANAPIVSSSIAPAPLVVRHRCWGFTEGEGQTPCPGSGPLVSLAGVRTAVRQGVRRAPHSPRHLRPRCRAEQGPRPAGAGAGPERRRGAGGRPLLGRPGRGLGRVRPGRHPLPLGLQLARRGVRALAGAGGAGDPGRQPARRRAVEHRQAVPGRPGRGRGADRAHPLHRPGRARRPAVRPRVRDQADVRRGRPLRRPLHPRRARHGAAAARPDARRGLHRDGAALPRGHRRHRGAGAPVLRRPAAAREPQGRRAHAQNAVRRRQGRPPRPHPLAADGRRTRRRRKGVGGGAHPVAAALRPRGPRRRPGRRAPPDGTGTGGAEPLPLPAPGLGAARGDGDPGRGRGLGSFVWIRPDQGAGPGACRCKAEEGADAEHRRLTTTRQMRVPGPASPA